MSSGKALVVRARPPRREPAVDARRRDPSISLAGPGRPFRPEPRAKTRLARQAAPGRAGQLREQGIVDLPPRTQPALKEPGRTAGSGAIWPARSSTSAWPSSPPRLGALTEAGGQGGDSVSQARAADGAFDPGDQESSRPQRAHPAHRSGSHPAGRPAGRWRLDLDPLYRLRPDASGLGQEAEKRSSQSRTEAFAANRDALVPAHTGRAASPAFEAPSARSPTESPRLHRAGGGEGRSSYASPACGTRARKADTSFA